ncbi:toxin-antitoxin system YwqK family antitoxin [Gallaecimonas xiamenensis]|uniref:MORN repeat-containing protein n=1 Tax=Gallaecimonas xiamenensis 3-C-1 TaxID=745411 RepID=K2JP97_9GAMM|nr:hypothetical protein [Gallaecimonas xiamenensis]EKE77063.1 hypothetical protein B3C1_02620 [Gallaecimonas xiamenensis 3-C-1]
MKPLLVALALLAFAANADVTWLDEGFGQTPYRDEALYYQAAPFEQVGDYWQLTLYHLATDQKAFEGRFARPELSMAAVLGPYRYYYPNGQLRVAGNQNADGHFEGLFRFYDPEGRLQSEGLYQGGVLRQNSRYYPGGQRQRLEHFDAEGRLDGLAQRWAADGRLLEAIIYQGGNPAGSQGKD